MNEVVILIFIAVFGDGPEVFVQFQPDMETCWRKVKMVYSQPPETWVEDDVRAVYADCLKVIPRSVPKPKT